MEYRGCEIKDNFYAGFAGVFTVSGTLITLASTVKEAKNFIDLDIDYFNSRRIRKCMEADNGHIRN